MLGDGMSNCTTCKIELTPDNTRFRYGHRKDKLNSFCRKCEAIKQKEYREAHKDRIKEYRVYNSSFSQRKSRRQWDNFSDYMRLNPVYFREQFGKIYTEQNVFSEYKRLDKLMQERGI